MTNYIIGHIRTFTPIAIGYAVTWVAANTGIIISDSTSTSVTLAAAAALTAAYYALARWLGTRWPVAERLLGTSAQPTYGIPASK